jgi:hypothetical protein
MAAHRRRMDWLRHRRDARLAQLTRKNGNVGMDVPLARVELTGVPETALWNLYQRASAARAGHLDDPRAVEVLEQLDYPFERFDVPYAGLAARLHALRVRTVDAAARRVPGLKNQLAALPVFQARLGLDGGTARTT